MQVGHTDTKAEFKKTEKHRGTKKHSEAPSELGRERVDVEMWKLTASAPNAPDWHEHTAAHLLLLIPILPVINEGCDRRGEKWALLNRSIKKKKTHHQCHNHKELKFVTWGTERLKQYNWARRKQVHAQSSYSRGRPSNIMTLRSKLIHLNR